MKNPFKKPLPDSTYYRTAHGVYTKVTGPKTFLKSSWIKGKWEMAENTLEGTTCAELFARKEWKPASEKAWNRHLEPLAQQGTGTRSQKPIEFVVEIGGVQYFAYKDDMDMPEGRRRELEIVWLEYSAQADREYLLTVPEAILAAIDHNPVKLTDIAQIATDMRQKLAMTFDFSLYEKLASVLYFDINEDTSKYDVMVGNGKIAHWREHGGMAFFLSLPIKELLPKKLLSTGDLNTSLAKERIRSKLILGRLEEVSKRLSTELKESSSGKPKPGE